MVAARRRVCAGMLMLRRLWPSSSVSSTSITLQRAGARAKYESAVMIATLAVAVAVAVAVVLASVQAGQWLRQGKGKPAAVAHVRICIVDVEHDDVGRAVPSPIQLAIAESRRS